MRVKKWHGTALFVGMFAVMGATVGLRFADSTGAGQSPAVAAAPAPAAAANTVGNAPSATGGQPGAAPAANVSITGAVAKTEYGPVQVVVTFSGSKITEATAIRTPTAEGRSRAIAAMSTPKLRQEVLTSQSAKIDTVSGATYTSEGYALSVQSAIDQRP